MTVCNVIRRKDAKPKVEKVVPLGQKLPLLLRDASLNSISDFAPDFVASSKATSIFSMENSGEHEMLLVDAVSLCGPLLNYRLTHFFNSV